jgi:hypothetical protein
VDGVTMKMEDLAENVYRSTSFGKEGGLYNERSARVFRLDRLTGLPV